MKNCPSSLLILLASALFLRLFIGAFFPAEQLEIVDEIHYNRLAVELYSSGCYAVDGELDSLRPPLYPWFLSQIYLVCGVENYRAVIVVQFLLALATMGAVWGWMQELRGWISPRASLIVTAVVGFYPSLVGASLLLLTETLFTFWLVLVLWSATRFFRVQSLYAASLCGAWIGLGALTRSILWLSPLPFFIFILVYPSGLPWSRRLGGGVLMVLLATVVMLPWMIRNTRVQNTPTAIDCMSGRNLMIGNYEYTPWYEVWDAASWEFPYDWYAVLNEDHYRRTGRTIHNKTQGEKDRLAASYAKRYMESHRWQTGKRILLKMLCFWQLERSIPAGIQKGFWGFTENNWQKKCIFWSLATGINAAYGALFFSALVGIGTFPYREPRAPQFVRAAVTLSLCVLLYFWVLHSIVFTHERYHLPLIPILGLFSGLFVSRWDENLEKLRKNKIRTGILLGIGIVFLIFWIVEVGMTAPLLFG